MKRKPVIGVRGDYKAARQLYNKMKRKEASMAAIAFPLTTKQAENGQIEIWDDNDRHICTCPDLETTQAVYLSLYCGDAAERVHRAAAAISGLGVFAPRGSVIL